MAHAEYIIFCDFDGTITKKDTTDDLLERHADSQWEVIEAEWKSGKIGSKECLSRQIDCIGQFSQDKLSEFIASIEIDEDFKTFIDTTQRLNIECIIVSDGFDLTISNILKNNNLTHLQYFANHLELKGDKLITDYPNTNSNCSSRAGTCKCKILETKRTGRKIIYIGDGRSDFCAIKHADLVFAKGSLIKECQRINRPYIEFQNFKTIISSVERGEIYV